MEVHVVKPIYNPHLCHHGFFVQGTIGQWQGWLEKDCPENGSFYLLFILCEVTFWWTFIWDTSIFIFFAHLEKSVCIFPRCFLIDFSNHSLSSLWPASQSIVFSQWIITHLAGFQSKQNVWPRILLEVLPNVKMSSRKGCNCSLLSGACIRCRTISKPGQSLPKRVELLPPFPFFCLVWVGPETMQIRAVLCKLGQCSSEFPLIFLKNCLERHQLSVMSGRKNIWSW